jgi:hypothetical protein
MNFDPDSTPFKALETAVYCPPFKDENAIETIILDEFDIEKAKEQIRSSINLLSYNKKYRPLILEILDVLHHNKHDFLVDQQKYISFYWNGILILRIEIRKDVSHDKQLHISLQKYASEKEERISDKKLSTLTLAAIGISLLVGGFVAGMTLFRRRP